jgi:hypothetical protein
MAQQLPQATVPQAAAASIVSAPHVASTPAPAIVVPDPGLEARLSSAPTRGYGSSDLSVLLSTFLL